MDIRREYRGWTIGIGTAERSRRKLMGHAARRERPHLLVMASGWGLEMVYADLCRQIDQAEANLADGSPSR